MPLQNDPGYNLGPMSSLDKAYDPKKTEKKWYSFWEEKGFFKADSASKKDPYCIVLPPPNVTGVLHMGHAFVDTIQDILIRLKRMQGFEALWIPGTDHAGIATQGVVEKRLFAETGKRRQDFGRDAFLKHAWEWKEKSQEQILSQIKELGCSCDWSRLRFTMDEGCNKAVRTCFKKMFDEKLIYRGNYLVNWDPVTQTALSDDEVEHEERASFLWYIRYPLENETLIIATTRPETMLGDTAIAVHPDDPKYKHLIGKTVLVPLTDRKIPIIADTYVDPEFGTGALKITPAHDFNDFAVGQRHNLPQINILTPDAKINQEGGPFEGLTIEEAREKVVTELKKQGLIEKIEPHTLNIGLSYRSKAVLQPYLSKQWFINMGHFKDNLISAVKEKRVKLIPPHWESTYFHWIENLRDWCISRQLWWGHQIPIWHNKENPEEMICFEGEGLPPEVAKNPDAWEQDPDVLDTWFSSALWPLSTLGWPEKTQDLKKFYPTSVLVTAHDILFFWVARMIMMGEYLGENVPFAESFIHGLIYGKSYWKEDTDGSITYISGNEKKRYDLGDPLPKEIQSKWEKMSKTKGNVIDPLEMIQEYGADAVRFALCSSATHARQIDLDQRRFEEFKNFANKIWNGSRFVLMNIESLDFSSGLDTSLLALEDRWILSALNRTATEIRKHFDAYAFDKASALAYAFFWNDFCSTYIEASKPVLFGKQGTAEQKQNKQKLLAILLTSAIRLLHPIAPFITEDIFQSVKALFPNLNGQTKDPYTKDTFLALGHPACMVADFPNALADVDSHAENAFAFVNSLVRSVRNIRTEMKLPPSEKTDLYVIGSSNVKEHQELLLALTPTKEIFFTEEEPTGFGAKQRISTLTLFIPVPESLKAREKSRLEKEKEKLEKLEISTHAKLSNADFREKAPEKIVTSLEETLTCTKARLQEIAQQIQTITTKRNSTL